MEEESREKLHLSIEEEIVSDEGSHMEIKQQFNISKKMEEETNKIDLVFVCEELKLEIYL